MTKINSMMSRKRTSPKWIDKLEANEIFVFGSNLEGRHGGGAAAVAKKWGAIWGQGVGLQGQTYAIPTMHGGVETIKPYVDEFLLFAKAHPGTEVFGNGNRLRHCRFYRSRNCTPI